MVLPRSSALRGSIRSFTLKRVGAQARTNLRTLGRRGYASEHGAQKSSDIPWLIGSVAVTAPAATWLWSQGPKKSDHGHGDASHAQEEHTEEPAEESTEGSEEKTEEAADEGAKGSSEEEATQPEGESEVSESKGDKDAKSDESGANNPLLDDDEKSAKPEGPAATAKISGTVDSSRSASGEKGPEKSEE